MGKWKSKGKHHIQENEEASPFPTGDFEAKINRHDSMLKKTQITKISTKEALFSESLLYNAIFVYVLDKYIVYTKRKYSDETVCLHRPA